jgi:hypothetical protein
MYKYKILNMFKRNHIHDFYIYRHIKLINEIKKNIIYDKFSIEDFDKHYSFFRLFLMFERHDNTRWISDVRIEEFLQITDKEFEVIEKYTLGIKQLNNFENNIYKLYLIKREFIKQYLELKNDYYIKKDYAII